MRSHRQGRCGSCEKSIRTDLLARNRLLAISKQVSYARHNYMYIFTRIAWINRDFTMESVNRFFFV